jgi:hypothetical protein
MICSKECGDADLKMLSEELKFDPQELSSNCGLPQLAAVSDAADENALVVSSAVQSMSAHPSAVQFAPM